MAATRRILITGADGRIGSILRRELADLDLLLLTRSAIDAPSHVADIAELDAIEPAFRGVDAVVHLAGQASPRAEWDDVLHSNIVGTRNVFEAARRAGVERIVFASSTHAVVGHELAAAPQIYELDDARRFGVDVEPRPDSLYGVSKVFGEALGRWYHERHGIRVVCLRIGWVWEGRDDDFMRLPSGPEMTEQMRRFRARARAIWLSHRDCARLFRAALEADVGWALVYGTSDNRRQIWDLEPARRLLGYRPLDGAPEGLVS